VSGEAFVPDDDEMDEVVPEEWPTFYTPVPVWVLLSGCTAQAYRMYAFLAEHINNRTPGKRIAFPSQKAIAKALGLKDARDVARYRDELADLGAIRFEEFRYAGGMRRRYRYWVRFNPPEGYTGMLSLGQFYEVHPQVKAATGRSIRDTATGKVAGQTGGGKKPTTGGGKKPTSQGGESPTAQQLDQEQLDPVERDAAPSARSAPEARRARAGSRAVDKCGSAASGKTKPPPLTREQRQQVQAVRALLPADLNRALGEKTPRIVSDAVLEGLASGLPGERTVEQLVKFRVMRRWDGHWAEKFYAGQLTRGQGKPDVVGPLLAMLRHHQECGSNSCDDRIDIHTEMACTSCEMRAVDRRADRESVREHPPVSVVPATVPAPRAGLVVGAPRGTCAKCPIRIIIVGPAIQDGLCRECRETERLEGART
jgi:hypothetical protein